MRQLTEPRRPVPRAGERPPERPRRRAGDPRSVRPPRAASSSSATSSRCSPSACRCCRRCAGGSPRCRSASTTRTGSTTRDFDLDFHVRELALPPPGTDEQLAEQVARIVSRPLDRARPLWELYLIHGLERRHVGDAHQDPPRADRRHVGRRDHGRAASTSTPRARELAGHARDAATAASPSELEMLARGAARPAALPGAGAARAARRRCRTSRRRAFASLPGAERVARASRARCAASSAASARAAARARDLRAAADDLQRPRLAHRRFVVRRSSTLDDVKAVKNAHGCTVNDVVVSICAGAVRRWLIEHDELPDDPLVAQIPVSVRTRGAAGHLRQPDHADERRRCSPTIADPVERLQRDARGAGRHEGAPQGAAGRRCSRTRTTSSRPPSSPAPRAPRSGSPRAAAAARPGTW